MQHQVYLVHNNDNRNTKVDLQTPFRQRHLKPNVLLWVGLTLSFAIGVAIVLLLLRFRDHSINELSLFVKLRLLVQLPVID